MTVYPPSTATRVALLWAWENDGSMVNRPGRVTIPPRSAVMEAMVVALSWAAASRCSAVPVVRSSGGAGGGGQGERGGEA